MFLAFAAFVVVVAVILGGYFAVTQLPAAIAQRKLDRRLRDVSMPVSDERTSRGADGTVVKRQHGGPLPALDRLVAESGIGSKLARLIQQSGVHTTSSAVILGSVVAGGTAALIADLAIRQSFAIPIAAGVGLAVPTLWLMRKRSVRLKVFEENFPEALDVLARAIRAGHAFQTAMGMVADELKAPVGPEFKKTFDQQNFGLPLRDALNEMSVRIPNLDMRFFVTAVLIQRDTGGNLSEILENLAHVVRERFKIRRQVRVHTAHGRFTGYVLLALPAALAVVLTYLNPELMRLLFQERLGQQMLIGAIVLQVIGYFWIRKVIKIEV